MDGVPLRRHTSVCPPSTKTKSKAGPPGIWVWWREAGVFEKKVSGWIPPSRNPPARTRALKPGYFTRISWRLGIVNMGAAGVPAAGVVAGMARWTAALAPVVSRGACVAIEYTHATKVQ